MNGTEDYCELCDLPRSQCPHGRPPAPPEPKRAAPAPSKQRKAPTRPVRAAAAPRATRWTPPEMFKALILEVLDEAGGALEAEELFSALEPRVEDRLRPADTERTPEGELRWHYAARRARVALIGEGRMTKSTPGLWELA